MAAGMDTDDMPVTPATLPAVPHGAASEWVADIIAGRILAGELVPGSRIKQDALAEELATSRIPVRDALRILEARGLVTMRANAGARVVVLTRRDVEISHEIRERIEPLLLAESVPHLTDDDIEELRAVLERGQHTVSAAEAIALGREFHHITCRRHAAPLLAQIVERVWDTTQSYRLACLKRAMAEGARMADLYDHEYRMLYDAAARREVETAQAALVLLIRRTHSDLVRYGDLPGATG